MMVEKKKTRSTSIPTSTLPDVAFLLLMFFLVTTTIDVDKGLSLVLPPKGETKEVSKKNILNILINAEGKVMVDDAIMEISMLKTVIQNKLAENPNLILSVKTDANTNYRDYVRVLDQLKQANAKKISIAEPEKS
ncbi:biopolymer transporter ExbD [candidate division KSB1 bacterium]|nr:biopolymer transporter ExbD [candidate division KSB1 bacterium]